MRKTIIFCLFLVAILSSCKTTQTLGTFEDVLYPNGRFAIIQQVDEGNQRKFEFYFFEANRLKAIGDYGKAAMYYSEAISADSACATCYFELANLLYASGDAKRAEEAAFRAVQLDPMNEWFVLFLSRVYSQNKKNDLALSSARYLVELKPDNFEYLYNLSQIEVSLQQYGDAAKTLGKIENILGMNEYLILEKYALYIEIDDYKNAEKELNKLIASFPSNYDYMVYLGDFYAGQNKLKEAFNIYEKVLHKDANNGPVHFSLANYYLVTNDSVNFKREVKSGFQNPNIELEDKIQRLLPFLMNIDDPKNPLNTQDFDEIFERLKITHHNEPNVYVLFGNYLNHKKREKEATDAFETALLLDEKQENVWQDFLFMSMSFDEHDDFLRKCLNGVNAFPNNALIQYLTAVAYVQKEEYNEAIHHLNLVLEYNADNERLKEQALGMLGDYYYQVGEIEKSFSSYEEALKLNGNSVVILNNFAYYLSLQNKDLDKAERMISKVIEFEPLNATYLDTYAWVLFKRERYFEALFVIEQAISNGGESNVMLEHYGDILYKNGDKEKALEIWKKAFDLGDEISDKLSEKIEKETYIE